MKGAAIVTLAVATFLGHTSGAAELTRDDARRPIIAQMLNDPGAYANKTVTIYGLVIQKNPNRFSFYKTFPSNLLRWSELMASRQPLAIKSLYAASSQKIAMVFFSRRVR